MGTQLVAGDAIVSVILVILVTVLFLNIAAIGRQPVQKIQLSFKVPLVPLVPCLSIFINAYLMLQLDVFTWIRFAVWLLIGFCIYGFYGINHSEQGKKNKAESDKLQEKCVEKFRILITHP
ncbi:High affinity cationic amino acid transporter 1 [Harpegnathos saltator]|uniref:High affinity cationic amino acid transporter 1 n=2 Tax=Harpegnathos saltator TaxID=610380 RepID=E2BY43_HARSA|nr:High affinity cationic amino acid transporter 1 [Harpegnathos saltator]